MEKIRGLTGSETLICAQELFYEGAREDAVLNKLCYEQELNRSFGLLGMVGFSNSLMTEDSRALYAFARDRSLPFSQLFSIVDAKKQIPIYTILLDATVQMAQNSIYFDSLVGFFNVIFIATEGFHRSYAMPLFVRILARFTGHAKALPGPCTLDKWGIWLTVIGLLLLTFAAIPFNFPSVAPVTGENMNDYSAATWVIALVSLVTWIVEGVRIS